MPAPNDDVRNSLICGDKIVEIIDHYLGDFDLLINSGFHVSPFKIRFKYPEV